MSVSSNGNKDFTLLAYSPLLGGLYGREDAELPNGYRDEEQMNRLQAVRHLVKETGHTPNQIVLAWMLQNAPVAIPLVAVSDSIQLEENLGALDIQLSSEQLDYLNQA
ncbi:aldo/keto reductase [Paenibacillus terrae]|uniref:aldo/keto reductase n=1 Tax=Paenibacillus terrae TaxID=159743 RepID=UPI0009DB16B6|nr:aldo/keto reductase [Paenibacillus terrae]